MPQTVARRSAVVPALAVLLLAGLWPAGPARADCTCRAGGQDYALGATVCLRSGGTERLARCEMALNNTSWTPLRDGCPSAGAARSRFAAARPAPAGSGH